MRWLLKLILCEVRGEQSLCFPMCRPALVKGFMQLYSVEQKRSQALEAHAAAFSTIKVPILISTMTRAQCWIYELDNALSAMPCPLCLQPLAEQDGLFQSCSAV